MFYQLNNKSVNKEKKLIGELMKKIEWKNLI